MAWSDAARAAAAEARRMHSSAKGDMYIKRDARTLVEGSRKQLGGQRGNVEPLGNKQLRMFNARLVKKSLLDRQSVARSIKAIRAGTSFPDAATRAGLQKRAVYLTALRNEMKKKG